MPMNMVNYRGYTILTQSWSDGSFSFRPSICGNCNLSFDDELMRQNGGRFYDIADSSGEWVVDEETGYCSGSCCCAQIDRMINDRYRHIRGDRNIEDMQEEATED